MREAISQALWEEMERDPKVFLQGEEVGVWGGSYAVTKGFYDHFGPERVRDTPISEAAIIGSAIGAALTGLRPVAELMTVNFALSAMDHIVNQAAKLHYMFGGQMKLPLVIRTVGGGGRQLAATHSQTLDVIFAYFPGLKVVAPGTPEDAKGLLKSAIRSDDPIFFIEHATLYQVRGEVPEGEYTIPIGSSKVQRVGQDVTIISYSKMLDTSLKAAEQLAQEALKRRSSTCVLCARWTWLPSSPPFGRPIGRSLWRKGGSPLAWARKSALASTKRPSTTSMPPSSASPRRRSRCPITARWSNSPCLRSRMS